jgi:P-type Cu+ transporter
MERLSLKLGGMSRTACEQEIAAVVAKVPGVVETSVNFALARATIVYNDRATGIEQIIKAIVNAGYQATPVAAAIDRSESVDRRNLRLKLLVSAAASILTMLGALPPQLFKMMPLAVSWWQQPIGQFVLATPIQFWCGGTFLMGSMAAIRERRITFNLTIAIWTWAVYIYATIATFSPQLFGAIGNDRAGLYYPVSILSITLILLGHQLETNAKARANRIVDRAVKRSPYSIRAIYQHREVYIPIEQVQIGDLILVRRGETIPIDGIITASDGDEDRDRIGERVLAGSIASTGNLTIEAVEIDRSNLVIPSHPHHRRVITRLADRCGSYLFFFSIGLSCLTALIWWQLVGSPQAVKIGMGAFVIGYPTTIGLAVSMSVSIGMAKAARAGIAIENGASLELLSRVKTIVFDLAGTLSSAKPIVTDFMPIIDGDRQQEIEILQLAASLAYHDRNPGAQAIVRYANDRQLPLLAVEHFEEIVDGGIEGQIGRKLVRVGMMEWVTQFNHPGAVAASNQQVLLKYDRQWKSRGKTTIWIEIDGELAGAIAVSETIVPGAKKTIEQLKQLGLNPVLLTVLDRASAERFGAELNIDRVFAEVTSAERVDIIGQLQAEIGSKHLVAMASDGIHHGLALATADLRIAIGTNHRQQTIASDIAIVNGNLHGTILAIELSRWTTDLVFQNILLVLLCHLCVMPIAIGLFYPLWRFSVDPKVAILVTIASLIAICGNTLRFSHFHSSSRRSSPSIKNYRRVI